MGMYELFREKDSIADTIQSLIRGGEIQKTKPQHSNDNIQRQISQFTAKNRQFGAYCQSKNAIVLKLPFNNNYDEMSEELQKRINRWILVLNS